jgi:hypothetical protein
VALHGDVVAEQTFSTHKFTTTINKINHDRCTAVRASVLRRVSHRRRRNRRHSRRRGPALQRTCSSRTARRARSRCCRVSVRRAHQLKSHRA